MNRFFNRTTARIFQYAGTGLLLAFAMSRIRLTELSTILSVAHVWVFLLTASLVMLMQFLFCVRTKILLGQQGMSSTLFNLFTVNVSSSFYNLVLPSSLSGGVIRWYRISKVGGERAQTLSVLLFERIYDNVSWLVLIVLSLVVAWFNGDVPLSIVVGGVAGICCMAVIALIAVFYIRKKQFKGFFFRCLPAGVADRLGSVVWSLQRQIASGGRIVPVLLLSIGLHVCYQFILFRAAGSFAPSIRFEQFLIVNLTIAVLCQIPVTIAGIGLNETAFGLLMPRFTVPAGQGITLGLFISAVNMVTALAGGLVELSTGGKYKKDVRPT